jgi:hypothetical protein
MKTIYQIMQELGIEVQQEQKTEVFLVPLGEHASKKRGLRRQQPLHRE